MIRTGDTWREASWDEAFAEIERGLGPILEAGPRRGRRAYLGNPNAHNLGALVNGPVLLQALGTTNVFCASTVDQMPKQVSAGLMFGGPLSVPVPDLDRTDYLLILGANPFASNGSLMTVPDVPGRLRAHPGPRRPHRRRRPAPVEDRGGGRRAPLHPARHRRPLPLRASCTRSSPRGSCTSAAPRSTSIGLGRCRTRRARLHARRGRAGLRHRRRRRSGASPATSPRPRRAAVYGRIGTCTQEFGTLASWLVDVVNVLTGNLDREGGAMFTRPRRGECEQRPDQAGRDAGGRTRASASGAGTAACAACPRSSASSRSSCSPRRSRRRARAGSAP